ncbi:Panacea domain-containing protein [Staphylococcus hominis]|uniref:Panacea domain-containing protein n=1 Tax=Staphylococcus hominis TaxID=1290 RepID=UPI0006B8E84A|nr:hypothetical protein [Staphylococcus hominis]KPG91690.1 hypothetical protein AEQ58_00665 [Staphylococcus hominis]MCI2919673.1 hypothetical protein [Staphylococcus hominis]MDS3927809.1 hypothetical protein [Staphylococcus hominis]OFN18181.1 hypothetical protein HMPREF2612_03270 [Staphylococcus sp. HMSC058D09]
MWNLTNHILAVADTNSMNITNLQLQKILYFSFKNLINNDFMTQNELEKMYKEAGPFLVWRYGPVNENIYNKFSKYGSTPILERGQTDKQFNNLNQSIIDMLKQNPFDLVEKSHQSSIWKNNENKIKYGRSNIPYQFEDLISEAV